MTSRSAFELLDSRDIVGARLDLSLRVHSENDGALEAMAFCQDPGEGGQGLLGAVFVVACHKDEVFSLTRAAVAFVDEGSLGAEGTAEGEETDNEQ